LSDKFVPHLQPPPYKPESWNFGSSSLLSQLNVPHKNTSNWCRNTAIQRRNWELKLLAWQYKSIDYHNSSNLDDCQPNRLRSAGPYLFAVEKHRASQRRQHIIKKGYFTHCYFKSHVCPMSVRGYQHRFALGSAANWVWKRAAPVSLTVAQSWERYIWIGALDWTRENHQRWRDGQMLLLG
jgi:hypothetical protein